MKRGMFWQRVGRDFSLAMSMLRWKEGSNWKCLLIMSLAMTLMLAGIAAEPAMMASAHAGVPDISLGGLEYDSTSTIYWYVSDATTIHTFSVPTSSQGDGTLTVTVDGDYNSSSEYADIYIEEDLLGTINPTVNGPTTESFTIPGIDLEGYLGDGMVEITVDNSPDVETGYGNDFHSVQLSFQKELGDTLSFGEVYVGYASVLGFLVSNEGNDVLTVDDIALKSGRDYIVDITNFSLDPGESQAVHVAFVPRRAGEFPGILLIESDDPNEKELTLALWGKGLLPPEISVSPDSLLEKLYSGDTSTRLLTIYNNGEGDLTFDISVEEMAASKTGKIDFSKESVAWLIPNPTSGIVLAGDSASASVLADSVKIEITFDATGLAAGDYFANIIINSNDPNDPVVVVPAHLRVAEDLKPPKAIGDLTIAVEHKLAGSCRAICIWWTEPYDNRGVSHYIIYRSTSPWVLGDSLAGTVNTFYTDADVDVASDEEVQHFYLVKAVDAAGNRSAESNRVGEHNIRLPTEAAAK